MPQPDGQRLGPGVEFGVGEPLAAEYDRRRVRGPAHLLGERLGEGGLRDVPFLAVRVGAQRLLG